MVKTPGSRYTDKLGVLIWVGKRFPQIGEWGKHFHRILGVWGSKTVEGETRGKNSSATEVPYFQWDTKRLGKAFPHMAVMPNSFIIIYIEIIKIEKRGKWGKPIPCLDISGGFGLT
jgi:hypothetical protein